MDYGARFNDPGLGRFTQPDTIVPDLFDPQSLNRYAYVRNNPVRYTDPTGHMFEDEGPGDDNGSGGHTDNRPYCERFPYANGCYTPPLPTTNDGAPNTDGSDGGGSGDNDPCRRCSDDDPSGAALPPPPIPVAKCPGNCYPPTGNPSPEDGGVPAGPSGKLTLCSLFGIFCGNSRNAANASYGISPDVRATFENGRTLGQYTKADQTWYRAEGGSSYPYGQYYGNIKPTSSTEAERLYNVVQYGNNVDQVSTYIVPKGTFVWEGPVAGGTGRQIFIQNPVQAGVKLIETEPLFQGFK